MHPNLDGQFNINMEGKTPESGQPASERTLPRKSRFKNIVTDIVVLGPGVSRCILNQAFTNAFPLACRAMQEQTSPKHLQPTPKGGASSSCSVVPAFRTWHPKQCARQVGVPTRTSAWLPLLHARVHAEVHGGNAFTVR